MPGLTEIYELSYSVLDNLPKKFRAQTEQIIIRAENFADADTLKGLHLKDKYDLLGLYRGVPIPYKNLHSVVTIPDTIFIYRCPIIRFAEENSHSIERIVHHVMIHEIGHHFGYSDCDIEWIERQP
jgi:predicted Zn-dependent protease with MMP-like domain